MLRSLARVALAVAVFATAARILQLAHAEDSHTAITTQSAPGSAGGSDGVNSGGVMDPGSTPGRAGGYGASATRARADAELTEFYQACPLAAVIDLQTVAAAPEKVDAILPPYREAADRVPTAAVEPAVPRIRYPVRIAQSPRDISGHGAEPSPNPSLPGSGTEGGWLIDPKDWFTPDEKPSPPAESNSDAAPTPPTPPGETPAAPQPPTQQPAEPAPPQPPSSPTPAPAEPPAPSTPIVEHPTSNIQHPASSIQQPPSNAAPGPAPAIFPAPPASPAPPAGQPPAVDPHLELFTKNAYPSARECAVCHEEIYNEWSVSAHAYAAVSPMFNKFEQRLNDLSQGTVGYFCLRCHSPVATAICTTRDEPLWKLPEAARDGITCIACHRVQYAYGKSNGERRVETGDIFAPVFGGIGGDGVADVDRPQR